MCYQEDIAAIFSKADKNNTGKLKADDFKEVINDIIERYPQVAIHLKKQQLKNFHQLVKNAQGNDEMVDIEKFKVALSAVDAQMKNLPATAQVKRDTLEFCIQQCQYLYDYIQKRNSQKLVNLLLIIGGCSTRYISG